MSNLQNKNREQLKVLKNLFLHEFASKALFIPPLFSYCLFPK